MMLLLSGSNTTGATSGQGSGHSYGAPEFNQWFLVMLVFLDTYLSSLFFVLFAIIYSLSFFLWPLDCFVLRRYTASDLITPLISSTVSYILQFTGIRYVLIIFSFYVLIVCCFRLIINKVFSFSCGHCLSFVHLRILIIHLVSSTFSYI